MNLEQLLARIADGDDRAMRALFDRERASLFRFFHRLCRCPSRADDLLQGTFLSLWRYRDRFRGAESAAAYLYKVALNEWRRSHGRERRHQDAIASRAATCATAVNGGSEPASDRIVDEERRAAVWRAIDALPPAQREAFVLHRFQELSCREIADASGEPVKTIESRLRLALLKLTERLRADEGLR